MTCNKTNSFFPVLHYTQRDLHEDVLDTVGRSLGAPQLEAQGTVKNQRRGTVECRMAQSGKCTIDSKPGLLAGLRHATSLGHHTATVM